MGWGLGENKNKKDFNCPPAFTSGGTPELEGPYGHLQDYPLSLSLTQ